MSTIIIERPAVAAPTEAAPLTEAEVDSLIGITAASQKIARVRSMSSGSRRTAASRGWSLGGNVD